ncbi:type IV-A pilus assembly ATPase PilB [Methyloprofundus sp.]|uniref:type IV-A pilus assembly ATPase PilB n=1 Tax=Methyloprofundus sp. TaxID=2020875 RepID=UPI00262B408F|nr:type IV-A pilus assembly ATPase PilB [Methyloprofundus sp.]
MAENLSDMQFSGVLKCIVKDGLLTEAEVEAHAREAQKNNIPLISYLVNNQHLDSQVVARHIATEFGVPFFDLSAIDKSILPYNLVSEKLIRQHHILPLFQRGNRLFIALSDPTNIQAMDDIKFHTRLNTETVLVEDDKLTRSIESFIETADTTMSDLIDADLENTIITDGNKQAIEDDTSDIDDAPIVRFVNKVFLDAIKKGASDIHLEPYEKSFRIRFRTDGMLSEIASPPSNLSHRIISRIKVMAKMDIAERRIPQDGRIKMKISRNRSIDFRVSTCPTLFGEKVVLRILDPTSSEMSVEELGLEPEQKDLFLNAIKKPYGMILVTGPTGSGKTVSLYTGLHILNTLERNISTAEDPVEITVEGINQVNMNVKAGLTFPIALRAFLRQDPDIIMVGEIRDLETADIAIKAAQTGHLVLSTLHTNDAPQTLHRLMQMGVPAFNIVSSVLLIMAQRLTRRLCEKCKTDARYPYQVLLDAGFKKQEVGTFTAYTVVGCKHCNHGYKGRVGIYQVMPISDQMRTCILEGGNTMQLAEQAALEGVNDLRRSGLLKVMQGVTSIEEIDRVTRE